MLRTSYKMLLCAAAMTAALPVVSVAGEEVPLSLSSRSLSVANAAKEEFVRHIPHMAHQNFELRILNIDDQYHVFIAYAGGVMRCDIAIPRICGEGCGRCFHVVIDPDVKIIRHYWYESLELKSEDAPESVLNGMVLPF